MEVRSLLEAYDYKPELLNESAFDLGLAVIGDEVDDRLSGRMIGSYAIEDLLGKGGMGTVYLARDLILERPVALKFLSHALTNDPWARKQLIREAQAVASLDHPNICPVYGYEEIDDYRFIVMQYVEGVSLAELVRAGTVDRKAIPGIALDISEAISEAHNHGIIHRDIKPGNIMITPDGHAKVLDFGLAKFIRSADSRDLKNVSLAGSTRPGLILGTVAYMSPEQLKAEKVDFRSDVFSIGTVLFELWAGKHPFERASDAETISAILDARTPDDQATFLNMPRGFGPVVKRCLQKKKEDRYNSASELVVELGEPREKRSLGGITRWFGVLFLLLTGLIVSSYFLLYRNSRPYIVAVLPYRNLTADPSLDYLSDGIADTLSIKLASYGRVKMKSLPPSVSPDLDPMDFGRKHAVDLVLTGNVLKENGHLFLKTNLVNIPEGVTARAWTLPFNQNELPALEEKVAEELFAGVDLNGRLVTSSTSSKGSLTASGEAARQYIIGRHYWKKRDRDNLQLAIRAFQRSIDADPGYARPHAGLADCYVLLNLVAYGTMPTKEAMTKARAAARQALEIDSEDAQANTSMGIVLTKYDWNWTAAESAFRQSIKTDPEYASGHYWYSSLLAILGRKEESILEAIKARELDPFSPQADLNLARVYYYARRYNEALSILADSAPTDTKARYMTGLIHLQMGRLQEAQNIFEELSIDGGLLAAAPLGFAYGKLGRREDALRIISALKERSRSHYVPPQEFAIIYVGLEDKENALSYLNESFKERHAALISIQVEPLFDSLRNDVRFQQLVKDMGLG